MTNGEGVTPVEVPRPHRSTFDALYEIPQGADLDTAVRICNAAMGATNGRLGIIDGDLLKVLGTLKMLERRHVTHWMLPYALGFSMAVSCALGAILAWGH